MNEDARSILAIIGVTAERIRQGGNFDRECGYTFCLGTCREGRNALDEYLVGIKDPLAYEPGTQEQRFRAMVRRSL